MSSTLLLGTHYPKEFSYNPNQTHQKRPIKLLKTAWELQAGVLKPVENKLSRRVGPQEQGWRPLAIYVFVCFAYYREWECDITPRWVLGNCFVYPPYLQDSAAFPLLSLWQYWCFCRNCEKCHHCKSFMLHGFAIVTQIIVLRENWIMQFVLSPLSVLKHQRKQVAEKTLNSKSVHVPD